MTGAVSIKEVSHALDLVDLCILMIHNSIVHIYSKKNTYTRSRCILLMHVS